VGQPAGAESGNPAPSVVPSLREWSGGRGFLTVGPGSRMAIGGDHEAAWTGDPVAVVTEEL
jgi:hypothetical protein